LQQQRSSATPMVMEHIDWALDQLRQRQAQIIPITPVPLAHHLGHKLKHLC
jgi:hypothetical protein